MADPLAYYACLGLMTDPRDYVELFEGLPTGIAELRRLVQGLLVHLFWAERYGLRLTEERKGEVQIRAVTDKLARIRELDDRPLTVTRPLERRLVGNCRDFSLMLCAILRHQGVPARARCGFATYFLPEHYEDHWICEYWKADDGRWAMVDAQLDEFQRRALRIGFDPCDVPQALFLPGGSAWRLYRAGEADPDRFGIFDLHGMWFIRGNLLRDLAALNKIELLPWDCWGLIERQDSELSSDDLALLGQVAALTLADNEAFSRLRSLYRSDARLQVPPTIRSYTASGIQAVDLTGGEPALQRFLES